MAMTRDASSVFDLTSDVNSSLKNSTATSKPRGKKQTVAKKTEETSENKRGSSRSMKYPEAKNRCIKLTQEVYKRAKIAALEQDVPCSELIEDVLRDYLNM